MFSEYWNHIYLQKTQFTFLFITSLSHNVNTLDAASCHCVWEPKEGEKKKNSITFLQKKNSVEKYT